MHLGNAFSMLMAWLAAKSCGGTMIMRVEDLDERARRRDVADLLMRDLEWLGLTWDEGPVYQSERGEVYAKAIARLQEMGLTYPCFCTRAELHAATAPHASDGTPIYQGTCRGMSPEEIAARTAVRPPATRLLVPGENDPRGAVSFDDLGYGHVDETLSRECGDFLVRRSDGVVAYQLAVAVDDGLMGVTQVVRGRDLLGSVARQMYIQRLLGLPSPEYGHVPLLVAADGRRLSKRDRDLDLSAIRERGVRPKQVVGALAALVGLVEPGAEASAEELVSLFSWDALRRHQNDIVVNDDFLAWV